MQYTCVYSCIVGIFATPVSASWRSENYEFPATESSCSISIWSNRIWIGSSALYAACVYYWFCLRYPGVIWPYRTYSQSISSTKDLLVYPITMSFDPLILWPIGRRYPQRQFSWGLCSCFWLGDSHRHFLILPVYNINVPVHGVDWLCRSAPRFSWMYERDIRV